MRTLHPALLLSLVLPACASEGFTPITDEEITELGLTEGLAGNTAVKTGNCMPGESKDCAYEPLSATLWVVPEANASSLPGGTPPCDVAAAGHQPGEFGALTAALESGRYGLEVGPGRYLPLVVEPDGCGTCVSRKSDDPSLCASVEVAAGEVTKLDVLVDRAVH